MLIGYPHRHMRQYTLRRYLRYVIKRYVTLRYRIGVLTFSPTRPQVTHIPTPPRFAPPASGL